MHLHTKRVCCNLGHSLPKPLTGDFLPRWIAFWSLARNEIPEVSSQHFPNSSSLLKKSMGQEIFWAPMPPYFRLLFHSMFRLATSSATWFDTLLTSHAKNHLPLTPDISHLETLCIVLHSLKFPFFPVSAVSLPFSTALSLSFAFPSCVPSQRFGLQLKLIQAWNGSDDFSWKNCIIFAYCFEPCYYPVACFTVIPLNRKTRMEKPLHSLCLAQQYFISKQLSAVIGYEEKRF